MGRMGYLTGGPEEWEILSEVQEGAPPTGHCGRQGQDPVCPPQGSLTLSHTP